MAFQTTINFKSGLGVPGELFDNGPHRAQPFILNSGVGRPNIFGYAFTVNAEGKAQVGNPVGTAIFAGYLVCPKEHALLGAANPLSPSLTLADGVTAGILNMGEIIISLAAPANIGDIVIYDNNTGAPETIAPGATLPAGKSFGHAVITRFIATVAGLAVINVTDVPVPPAPTP